MHFCLSFGMVRPLTLDKTNEIFVLKRQGEFAYETRSTPELPTSRHVLVKIIATGICGSDVCIHASPTIPARPRR